LVDQPGNAPGVDCLAVSAVSLRVCSRRHGGQAMPLARRRCSFYHYWPKGRGALISRAPRTIGTPRRNQTFSARDLESRRNTHLLTACIINFGFRLRTVGENVGTAHVQRSEVWKLPRFWRFRFRDVSVVWKA